MKLFALTAALLLSATAASTQEFYFDVDGGRCTYDETGNSWTPYAEIGIEGMFYIDMPRAYVADGVVLDMRKTKGGMIQVRLQELGEYTYHDGKPFWATFDPKNGFFAEGKYNTAAEVKQNNLWYNDSMKPCH